jgi:uncharacterized SAM-binding protein YcdF (DUF218 family)
MGASPKKQGFFFMNSTDSKENINQIQDKALCEAEIAVSVVVPIYNAYDYLQAHPDTVCIVSGGQGSGEDITEAECMYRYLSKKGIQPERIIQEDKATSTQENLIYSLELIGPEKARSVGILSSEYHLCRARQMAQKLDLNPIMVPAKTTRLSLRVNYFLREIAALWYYMIFGG